MYLNEHGYQKSFHELNDDEMFEVLREQNKLFQEVKKQPVYKPTCHCQAPKFSWSYEKENKIINNSK